MLARSGQSPATAWSRSATADPPVDPCSSLFLSLGCLLCFPDATQLIHALGQQFFPALGRWMIELPAMQIFRQAFHVGHPAFKIMRILIAFAISELLHQWCGRIS